MGVAASSLGSSTALTSHSTTAAAPMCLPNTPLYWSRGPSAPRQAFDSPLQCSYLLSKEMLAQKILLSEPADVEQQKVKDNIIMTLQLITQLDVEVYNIILAILQYLPDFRILVSSEISMIFGQTMLANYDHTQRAVTIFYRVKKNLLDELRHEMRHCFWHLFHLTIKDNLTSIECFPLGNATIKNNYDRALRTDMEKISPNKESIDRILASENAKKVRKKCSPSIKKAYPLLTSHEDPIAAAIGGIYAAEKVLQSYPIERRSFERDAMIFGWLPRFLREFLLPNWTKLLDDVIARANFFPVTIGLPPVENFSVSLANWLTALRLLSTYDGIDLIFKIHGLDYSYNTLNELIALLKDTPNTEHELNVVLYALNHIVSNPEKFKSTKKANFEYLYMAALSIKERRSGIVRRFIAGETLYNRLSLDEACKAYLRAYRAGELKPEDYIDCLTKLKESRNAAYFGKFKEIKREGLRACANASLSAYDYNSAQELELIRAQIRAMDVN